MVLAFLQAEVSSPRFSKFVLPVFEASGLSPEELLHQPDLEDERQNAIRRAILGRVRGFGANGYLFTGFPSDVEWRFIEIEKSDHDRLKFANEQHWVGFTNGSRMVMDLAERVTRGEVPDDPAAHIRAIQNTLTDGTILAPIILVQGNDSELILVEGHCRATAFVGLGWGTRAILGSSPYMSNWVFF